MFFPNGFPTNRQDDGVLTNRALPHSHAATGITFAQNGLAQLCICLYAYGLQCVPAARVAATENISPWLFADLQSAFILESQNIL
jgi:hypothetical protein